MHYLAIRKLFLFFFTVLFVFNVKNIIAQKNFEGKVKLSISEGSDEINMNYFMKNGMIRIEMPGSEGGAMIMKNKKMFMLIPQQKMYMEFSMDKMKEMAKKYKDKDSGSKDENFDINSMRTGKTKEIFGHKCEQWIYNDKDENETVEMWVATDMGNFFFAQNPMSPSGGPAWQRQLEGRSFFPMEVFVKGNDGKTKSVYKVTEVKEESVNDNLFSIPSDFNKMSIPGM